MGLQMMLVALFFLVFSVVFTVTNAKRCRRSIQPRVLFPTLEGKNAGWGCSDCTTEEIEKWDHLPFPIFTRAEDVVDGQTCRILNAKDRTIWLGFKIDDARIAYVSEFGYNTNVGAVPLLDASEASLYGRLVMTLRFNRTGNTNLRLYADEVINGKKTRIGDATVRLTAMDDYSKPPKGPKQPAGSYFQLEALPPPPACFPSDAEVRLKNGAVKRMDELVIGDLVLAKNGQYSPVIMFTHKDDTVVHRFIELQTHSTKLLLSYGHYLQLNDRLEKAGFARVGDLVEIASGRQAPITAIRSVSSRGLYNPQTSHGTILVNGVVASCYTEAIPAPAAHALLAVLRAEYNMIGIQRGRQQLLNEFSALP